MTQGSISAVFFAPASSSKGCWNVPKTQKMISFFSLSTTRQCHPAPPAIYTLSIFCDLSGHSRRERDKNLKI